MENRLLQLSSDVNEAQTLVMSNDIIAVGTYSVNGDNKSKHKVFVRGVKDPMQVDEPTAWLVSQVLKERNGVNSDPMLLEIRDSAQHYEDVSWDRGKEYMATLVRPIRHSRNGHGHVRQHLVQLAGLCYALINALDAQG